MDRKINRVISLKNIKIKRSFITCFEVVRKSVLRVRTQSCCCKDGRVHALYLMSLPLII